jgi:hypothetical protein
MKSQEIQTQLDAVRAELLPLREKEQVLARELGRAKSVEFIAANAVTRADVESPDGHGQWFNTIWQFADWMRTNSNKNWAEWNTIIYRTSDLLAGRMPDMPARTGDLS